MGPNFHPVPETRRGRPAYSPVSRGTPEGAIMFRVPFFLALGVLVVSGSGVGPLAAGAESSAFRLHVRGHSGSGGSLVNIDVPWDSDKAGSPFNFTAEACDDIALERLRWAWAALRRMP